LKISKEIKAGVIGIAAITLFILGINFLKGSSFFGGDDNYVAYFPNSGQLAVASSVTLNGVIVGKVVGVDFVGGTNPEKVVRVKFNIQNSDIKIQKGAYVEIGSLDLFSKALILHPPLDISKGVHKAGDEIPGILTEDVLTQVKNVADPIVQRVQTIMGTIDNMAKSLSAFWDTTANSELQSSMKEVKIAIKRLSRVAEDIDLLVMEEKAKFGRIMSNVENITANLKKSNDEVTAIIGNTKTITDDLVTADFKGVIANAGNTLKSMNEILEQATKGEGTLGKLLGDEKLYEELINTNKELQNLVNDLQLHPERYIHFSVLGAKTKGVPLTGEEEKKLRKLLENTP
jgi:phospholipid/cholesterol/gamma-HCH transport system substrate-binding protein